MTRPLSITASGNAQISTAQSKFGGSSLYLDGTGDYLTIPSSTELGFGTGDFTIEMWIYKTTGTNYKTLVDMRTTVYQNSIFLGLMPGNNLYVYVNANIVITGGTVVAANTWNHIALTKQGNSLKLWLNGSQQGSTYTDTIDYASSKPASIGCDYLGNYGYTGYIDELRITKGLARYTSAFTPVSTKFSDDGYTSLLIHADGTNGSTTVSDDNSMASYAQSDSDGLYIADSYFDVDGYYTYQAEAQSAVSSQAFVSTTGSKVITGSASLDSSFSQTTTLSVIKNASITLESSFTQTATISHIFGSDMFAFAEAALSAQASVIKQSNIEVSAQFNVATDISRVIHFSADDFANATVLVGNNTRVRFSEAAVDAAFSLEADVGFIPGGEIVTCTGTWTSSFDIECKGTRKQNIIDCDVPVEFTQSAIVSKAAGLSSSLEVSASLIASVGKLQDLSSTVTSAFSVSASGFILNKRPRYTTAVNNITTSTAQQKLGSHSLYRPDSTSRLDVYPSKDFQIVNGQDFVIEFFYYPTYGSATGEKYILNSRSSGVNWFRFGYTATNNYLFFDYWNGSSTTRMQGSATAASKIELNRWNYIRVQRINGSMTLYLDNQFYYGTIDTDNYNGDIVPSPEAPTISIGYYTSNVATGYYDELYFATSTSSNGQTPTYYQELTTGAESTTQFLFHFNGNYVDDTHGVQIGQAALTSQASVSVIGSRLISAPAALSTQFSLTADAIKFGPQSAQASLASESSLSAQVSKVSTASAELSSNGFVVAATGRIRPETAALDVTSSMSADAVRTRFISSQLSSNFGISITVDSFTPASASLTSVSNLEVSATRLVNASSSFGNNFLFSATAQRIVPSWKVDTWGRGLTNAITRTSTISNNDSYEFASYNNTVGGSTYLGGFTLIKRDLARGLITWKINYPIDSAAGKVATSYKIQKYQGNIYVNFGYEASGPTYYNQMLVIDPEDGSIVNQFELNQFQRVNDFIIDNDYIYASGEGWTSTATVPQIIKYDLSGTVLWRKRRAAISNTIADGQNLFIRNNNLYWSYRIQTLSNLQYDSFITKVDSSTGSVTWTQSFGFTSAEQDSIYVDSNENVYALGATTVPLNSVIVKLNSSGNLSWAKETALGYSGNPSITEDLDNNIVLSTATKILSLDPSGSVNWAKTWQTANFYSISIDGDSLYAYGSVQPSSTYNSIIWQAPASTGGGDVTNISYPYGTFSYSSTSGSTTTLSYSLPAVTTPTYQTSSGYYSFGLNAEATSNSETSFTYFYAVNATGTWESTTDLTADAIRLRGFASSMAAEATESVTATRILKTSASLASSASLTLSVINATRNSSSQLNAQAGLSADVQKIKNTSANLQAHLEQTTIAVKTAVFASTQGSLFEEQSTALRIKQLQIALEAISYELTAAFKNATGTISMEASASMFINPRKITDQPIYFVVNSQLSAQGVNTQFGSANLQAQAVQTTQPTYLRHTEAHLASQATQSTQVKKITGYSATLNSLAVITSDTENSRIRTYSASMLSQAGLTNNNQILRLGRANLQVEATIPYVYAGVLVRMEADLLVEGFTVIAGQVLNIDPYYQLKITKESRTLLVLEENRLLPINQETRVNKIIGYPQ